MKIRNKLSLQFIIITVGIYSLSMLFVYDQFKNHLEGELFNNLESRARMTAEKQSSAKNGTSGVFVSISMMGCLYG